MRRVASLVVLVLALLTVGLPGAHAAGPPRSYIVVFKDSVDHPGAIADEQSRAYNAKVLHVYRHALRGYAASMSDEAASRIAADSRVAYVEPDGEVQASVAQTSPPWGLDRIDQRTAALDQSYTYTPTGSGVTAYVIDTGIRLTHSDFGGRAVSGKDTVDNDFDASDCNGHGTHVAGTIGGATHGVAKSVSLIAVRVLNCSGSGTWAGVIAGIDWVTAHHATGAPAVANMSLGGGASSSVDQAVRNSIADGVSYAVAAGNGNNAGVAQNACNYSPARVTEALTVGATDSLDRKASWSNYGSCLDLFAPGVGIKSAWYSSDSSTNTISGTSMATPHVAGVAALYLQGNPGASPATVAQSLRTNATPDVVASGGTGSPNLLLYSLFTPPPPPTPDTTEPTITDGPRATVTDTSATITWTTDEASSSHVDYGPTSGFPGSFSDGPGSVTSHSVTLGGLNPATTYYYTVTSVDGSNNTTTSPEAWFTTPAEPPPDSAMSVVLTPTAGGRTGKNYNQTLQVHASASDQSALAGAAVTLVVYTGACGSSSVATFSGTTDSSGDFAATFKTKNTGSYCARANVTASGYSPGSADAPFVI